jgi:hypothetical protein
MLLAETFRACRDAGAAFRVAADRTLEDVLGWYLKQLVLSALFAAVASFTLGMARAAYLDLVHGVFVEYWRLANYLGQVAVGTAFLVLFLGTFGLFAVTLIAHRFASGAKYTRIVSVTAIASAPLLLFGWVYPPIAGGFLVWSAVLLVEGIASLRAEPSSRMASRVTGSRAAGRRSSAASASVGARRPRR